MPTAGVAATLVDNALIATKMTSVAFSRDMPILEALNLVFVITRSPSAAARRYINPPLALGSTAGRTRITTRYRPDLSGELPAPTSTGPVTFVDRYIDGAFRWHIMMM